MAGGNELDNLSAGEPAICEDVVKVYFLEMRRFIISIMSVILLSSYSLIRFYCMAVLVTFLLESSIKLLLLQVVRPLLSFLTNKTEVHEHPESLRL